MFYSVLCLIYSHNQYNHVIHRHQTLNTSPTISTSHGPNVWSGLPFANWIINVKAALYLLTSYIKKQQRVMNGDIS